MGGSKTLHVLWWSGHKVAQIGFPGRRQRLGRLMICTWLSRCEALGRPLHGVHPEETTALTAKADLLLAGVKVFEASPWAADQRAAEIVAGLVCRWRVPPKSLARDMAFAAAEAVYKLRSQRNAYGTTSHHDQCGRTWLLDGGHAQVTDRIGAECAMEDGCGATPEAGPRTTCALRKGNDRDMSEQSLAADSFHSLLQIRRSQKQAASRSPVHIAQAHSASRGTRGFGAPCPRTQRMGEKQQRGCTGVAVRHLGCGLLVPRLWVDVSVRCPRAERKNERTSKPGPVQLFVRRRRRSVVERP